MKTFSFFQNPNFTVLTSIFFSNFFSSKVIEDGTREVLFPKKGLINLLFAILCWLAFVVFLKKFVVFFGVAPKNRFLKFWKRNELLQYTGWAKSQYPYVGSYTTAMFYIWGLLLCRWQTVPTCSRIPSPKFENSNILDHSILKHLYCSPWTCWRPKRW